MFRYSHLSSMLNKRGELWHYEKSDTMNELGQYPIEERLKRKLYCGVIPQTGTLLAGRVGDTALTKTTHKVIIRYIDYLKPDDWFIIDGERYNVIYALDPYLNKERLEVYCEVII